MKKGDELLKDLFDISGKVALITGATGGFGKTISIALAMAGAKVMATGRSEDSLKPLVQEIEKEGGTAAYSAGSPIDHDDVKQVIKDTVDTFGRIDILITAAGTSKPAAIVDHPLEEWEMIMDTNVKGTYLFCKEAGKVMIDQGDGGKVVLLGSARGELGMALARACCTKSFTIRKYEL